MSRLWPGLPVLILAACCCGSAVADSFWHTDLDQARAEAEKLNRPILCHFGAKWCGPCQQMERQVLNQQAVTEQLKAAVVGLKIDADRNPELVRRFGIDRFPMDVFIEPNGKRLLESTGYRGVKEYTALINRAGSRYADLLASRQAKPPAVVTSRPDKTREMPETADSDREASEPQEPMLNGYCPVTLWTNRRWEQGSGQFTTVYKDQLFQFVSEQARDDFEEDPGRYVPQLLGCDPVIAWETDRAVAGSIQWGAFYDESLYLFTSEENRREFRKSPDKYTQTRVVLHVDQIEPVVR